MFVAAATPLESLARSLMMILGAGLVAAAFGTWLGGVLVGRAGIASHLDQPPRRTHYLVLAVAFTVFAIYGFLLPLNFNPLPFEAAWERFAKIPFLTYGAGQGRADWIATILFFAPLGFLATGALTADERSRAFSFFAACLVGVGGAALSVAIEFTQLWFQPRTVSQNDILGATLGVLLGVFLWLIVGQTLTGWIRAYNASQAMPRRTLWLLRAYTVALIIYSIMPMDFVLHADELAAKYRAGRLELLPFAAHVPWYTYVVRGLLWLPVGALAGWQDAKGARAGKRRWFWAAICLMFGTVLARALVFSRFASVADVFLGAGALVAGVWFEDCWRRGRLPAAAKSSAWTNRVWPWAAAALAYALVLLAINTYPWEFNTHPEWLRSRLRNFAQVPFAALYWGSKLNALTEVMESMVLFLPLGVLVQRTLAAASPPRGLRFLAALAGLAAIAGLAVAIEMIQVHLSSHASDVTHVLLAAAGAGLGFAVASGPVSEPQGERRAVAAALAVGYGALAAAGFASFFVVSSLVSRGENSWAVVSQLPRATALPATTADASRSAVAESRDGAPAPRPQTVAETLGSVFLEIPQDPFAPPRFEAIPVPDVPGALAIWGATGRDTRGHIWFGVSCDRGAAASAHLCEYLPDSGQVVDRGDVLSALRACGVYRAGASQMKIHSRIVQGGDGHLYFASMDEQGEVEDGSKLPWWGSHIWRLRLPENRWEHLVHVPEGLIAAAGGGDWIYALGYFGHVLYRYHIPTGELRSVVVGSVDGHISRNFICDHRGHVYVPRLRREGVERRVRASLVEFSPQLEELGETTLPNYTRRDPTGAHGIVSFQHLIDRSIAFCTDVGYIYRITPSVAGPAAVSPLGWFHPQGESYTAAMFTYAGQRYLLGLGSPRGNPPYEWIVFDLESGTSQSVPIPTGDVIQQAHYIYGSMTRDDLGSFYVVGGWKRPAFELNSELERALRSLGSSLEELESLRQAARPENAPAIFRVRSGDEEPAATQGPP